MRINETGILVIEVILIAFGLFLAYQALMIILGGSWGIEEFILGIVTLNLSLTVAFAIKTTKGITKLTSDLEHLTADARELKADFKECRKEHTSKSSKS